MAPALIDQVAWTATGTAPTTGSVRVRFRLPLAPASELDAEALAPLTEAEAADEKRLSLPA